MLRVHQIPLDLDAALHFNQAMLKALAAKALSLPANRVKAVHLRKRSVDARDKSRVFFRLTADVDLVAGESTEQSAAGRFKPNQVSFLSMRGETPSKSLFHLSLQPWGDKDARPVVVGAGPAGLFCAMALALRGARPVLLERGEKVEERARRVAGFLTRDATPLTLDPDSNVLFGEGGAGAFSDGKLTCGLNSPHIRTVLETFCACGAPEEILTAQRPHIGTDQLRPVLAQMRQRLLEHGGEIRFGHRAIGLELKNGRVDALQVLCHGETYVLPTQRVYLAIGHSARDTYTWLYELGLPMEAKPFAIGARVEHPQADINRAQYGGFWEHPALPPAEYKLNVPTPDGRGVYTFCMCPGGQVIPAMQEAGMVNVNGMSLHARDGVNANAALLTAVRPGDFGSGHPLAGMEFQRRIEAAAYAYTGSFAAPCQRVEDLMRNCPTVELGPVTPSYPPGVFPGDLSACLPEFVMENFRYALPLLGQRLHGFDMGDALLTGPETRSSSPVRLLRDARGESALKGIYPLGEGAGYAGGIVSAAVDGLRAGMEG